jgi:superfamily I DNA and RNA helicase
LVSFSEGVYFNACKANNIAPVTLREARSQSQDPFDYACSTLLNTANVRPVYDYIFVDEGQDFPASFVQLCLRLVDGGRLVFAYDDLQTIFQATTPSINEIVGTDKEGNPLTELTEDVILYKCYRNPREILVCAHALGFGIYGRKVVQMLENKEQWEDIGYRVMAGNFLEGSKTEIERPEANSLATISMNQAKGEIVKATVFDTPDQEIDGVVTSIGNDLREGLRPDDILVVVVDDRNAKRYLQEVADRLTKTGITSNNMHTDSYAIRDFLRDGQVTLSTVHKAKGNEAFMVYVMGVDALYGTYAGVRERNVLFTAMTRAKGWVRVSGIGAPALLCKQEIDVALENFPLLKFAYPSDKQRKIIKRDLAERAIRKQQAERQLDVILDQFTPEEISRYFEQRAKKIK